MTSPYTIALLFLIHQLSFTQSLRCAVDCAFSAFPLNVSVPMNACKHEQRDRAQCSVVVEIDFNSRFASGRIDMQDLSNIASLRLETKFQINPNSLITTIWYKCAMSDNCDFEFLDGLMTNSLADLDATSIQHKLIRLLYNSKPDPTDIKCSHTSCSYPSFCQGDVENIVTWQYNYTYANESLPCIDISPDVGLLEMDQVYIVGGSQITVMTARCNHNECNNQDSLLEVYELMKNEFSLPLNDSFFNTNITFTTTLAPSAGSFLGFSYGYITCIAYIFFFHFCS